MDKDTTSIVAAILTVARIISLPPDRRKNYAEDDGREITRQFLQNEKNIRYFLEHPAELDRRS
jgi:hypothetical protein